MSLEIKLCWGIAVYLLAVPATIAVEHSVHPPLHPQAISQRHIPGNQAAGRGENCLCISLTIRISEGAPLPSLRVSYESSASVEPAHLNLEVVAKITSLCGSMVVGGWPFRYQIPCEHLRSVRCRGTSVAFVRWTMVDRKYSPSSFRIWIAASSATTLIC